MAKGDWAATDASTIIVAADEHRGSVVIQLQSAGDPTSLALDEDAIFGEGLQLINHSIGTIYPLYANRLI